MNLASPTPTESTWPRYLLLLLTESSCVLPHFQCVSYFVAPSCGCLPILSRLSPTHSMCVTFLMLLWLLAYCLSLNLF